MKNNIFYTLILAISILLIGCDDGSQTSIPSCGGSGIARATEQLWGKKEWSKITSYYYIYKLEVYCNNGTSYMLNRSDEFEGEPSGNLNDDSPDDQWILIK